MRTKGRYIIDSLGSRVKWSCVNWHGAQQRSFVMGGLQRQDVRVLAQRIASLGFNCVRLVYSTEGVVTNPKVNESYVAANPQLRGCRFLECLDAVVEALTQEHVMVIMNNHLNTAGWCCNINQEEGLWYTKGYNASTWMHSVVQLAARYKDNPWVVAHDLRNEPHSYENTYLEWGSGDVSNDYLRAMETAGNAVLDVAPDVLIVIEALCFGMELRPVIQRQVQLKHPNRVVYEVHNYQEFQFSTLFNTHFYSWSYVRRVIESAVVILILALTLVGYSCRRLKWPWAPQGVFLVSFGSWVTAASLIGICIFSVAFVYYRRYCHYIAEYDIKPVILAFFGLLLLGCVLLVAGLIRAGPCKSSRTSRRFKQHRDCDDCLGMIGDADASDFDDASDTDSIEADKMGGDPETSHDEDLGPLNLCVRARSPPSGGPCCFRGFGSCRIAQQRTVGRQWREKRLQRVAWDCGLCCMFQACIGIPLVVIVLGCLWFYAYVAQGETRIEAELDRKWAFVLQEGYPYTAPVWMGEFGTGTRGSYWVSVVQYLSQRDLDWAYWPLNPDKLTDGYFDDWGGWHPQELAWQEDSYSILEMDYMTVRDPWRLLDLHALMSSPAKAVLNQQPCQRSVLGRSCGG